MAQLKTIAAGSYVHSRYFFDRRFPEVDFDTIDLPSTGTLPVAIEGAARLGGIRNRQQTRQPIRPTT